MEDQDIINLIQHRSEDGLRELSAKYENVMFSIAKNIVGTTEDAEECVNDACLIIWNTVLSVTPVSLSAYCCRIVRNVSFNRLDYLSAEKRCRENSLCYEELEEIISTEEFVEKKIEAKDLKDAIETFLYKQSDLMRMVFVRRYWYNDSFEELERMTGIKSVTLRSQISRIKKKLRKYLKCKEFFE